MSAEASANNGRRLPGPARTAPAVPGVVVMGRAGVVAVVVGSVTFVAGLGGSPTSPPKKTAIGPAGATNPTTSTTPKSPTTTIRHQGQVTSSRRPTVSRHDVPLGVYAGEGDPAGVAAFAAATGTHPTYATDYLDKGPTVGPRWTAPSNIKAWSSSPYRLAIGVPILPGVGTLAQGATGAYNQYFTILGKNLVSRQRGQRHLAPGMGVQRQLVHLVGGNATDAANFVAFWRQIVTTMRAVPGEKFKFLWNPNAPSPTTYSPDQAYPGNAYVDYVGTDVYDNFWGTPFTPPWRGTISCPSSGGWTGWRPSPPSTTSPSPFRSGQTNTAPTATASATIPSFVDNMADWFVGNDVAFANVWSYDSSATYRNNLLDGTFPKALAMFKRDFG